MSRPLLPDLFANRTSFLLISLGRATRRLVDDRLGRLDIRLRHYTVLKALSKGSSRSQQELSDFLQIDVATMVATVDDLDAKGLVERRRDPADRRRHSLVITRRGTGLLGRADRVLDAVEVDVAKDLTADQREGLREALAAAAGGPHLSDLMIGMKERSGEPPPVEHAS
ncbi:MAG: MarR family winged helix-turn-helix transcriptional regulator [Actinomycetota bacterium]|nr:MarR family winged helix-turn-helix transcriptional regulator [Actinomycetota bacterium]